MITQQKPENTIVAINRDFTVFIFSIIGIHLIISGAAYVMNISIGLSRIVTVYNWELGLALFLLYIIRRKHSYWIALLQFILSVLVVIWLTNRLFLRFDILPFIAAPFLAVLVKFALDKLLSSAQTRKF
jgi:hypothetical protein